MQCRMGEGTNTFPLFLCLHHSTSTHYIANLHYIALQTCALHCIALHYIAMRGRHCITLCKHNTLRGVGPLFIYARTPPKGALPCAALKITLRVIAQQMSRVLDTPTPRTDGGMGLTGGDLVWYNGCTMVTEAWRLRRAWGSVFRYPTSTTVTVMRAGKVLDPPERVTDQHLYLRLRLHWLSYALRLRCRKESESVSEAPWVWPWQHRNCERCGYA